MSGGTSSFTFPSRTGASPTTLLIAASSAALRFAWIFGSSCARSSPAASVPQAGSAVHRLVRRPRATARAPSRSHELDPLVLERHGADALAARAVERVDHRRRSDADGGLANAAPHRAAARHDDRLDLRHLPD